MRYEETYKLFGFSESPPDLFVAHKITVLKLYPSHTLEQNEDLGRFG